MSIPWLVPHTGALALIGFLPLMCADALADQYRVKHFWIYHFSCFVLWNAITTFWVCNATVGGGIFAVLANALQMSVVWGVFRLSKKRFTGVVPYIFLAVTWIAWERIYFSADISWPWLVLGNAFARSTRMVQWYEFTGTLGGSLWVWLVNLGFFGMLVAAADGIWSRWNPIARTASMLGMVLVVAGPLVLSKTMYDRYRESDEGTVAAIIAQPNFDPYQKFESMPQSEQTAVLLDLFESELRKDSTSNRPVLLIAPETFTGDIVLNDPESSPTMRSIRDFLRKYPRAEMLFGASTYETFSTHSSPSILARPFGDGWIESRNSAILADAQGGFQSYHKSRLVVGTEKTPYPEVFVPIDNWLSKMMNTSGLMGRCIGQDSVSVMHFDGSVPLGCAVCYESVYGEYCTGYEKEGAKMMTVITNDAWWGNTPGYRQHLSYSCLRAIELRRDFARCGNTGISCFIDQRGDIISQMPWWTRTVLKGTVNLNSKQTFFARNGDIAGRICTLMFLLLTALLIVRFFIPKR